MDRRAVGRIERSADRADPFLGPRRGIDGAVLDVVRLPFVDAALDRGARRRAVVRVETIEKCFDRDLGVGRQVEVSLDEVVPLKDVRCRQRLGGVLKSYSRRAA